MMCKILEPSKCPLFKGLDYVYGPFCSTSVSITNVGWYTIDKVMVSAKGRHRIVPLGVGGLLAHMN